MALVHDFMNVFSAHNNLEIEQNTTLDEYLN